MPSSENTQPGSPVDWEKIFLEMESIGRGYTPGKPAAEPTSAPDVPGSSSDDTLEQPTPEPPADSPPV